jgi:hypothetical protein
MASTSSVSSDSDFVVAPSDDEVPQDLDFGLGAPSDDEVPQDLDFGLGAYQEWLQTPAGGNRNAREAGVTCAVALHFLRWAQLQPLPALLPWGAVVDPLDRHCLTLERYDGWLGAAPLSTRQPATQRATLFRLKRYILFRRARVAPFTRDGPSLVAGYGTALQHIAAIIKTLSAAATRSQSLRFNRDALVARGEWATIPTLLRALTQNRAQWDLILRQGTAAGSMLLKDRCCASFHSP